MLLLWKPGLFGAKYKINSLHYKIKFLCIPEYEVDNYKVTKSFLKENKCM